MRFRTGKYAGMTLDHVKKIAPWYIQWVRENRPEMLKERSVKPKIAKPNYEFSPDKPSPYLASPEEAFGMNFPSKEIKPNYPKEGDF
jgi:hypothetical protein